MSWFYPIQYKDEIRQYSQTYEVDPFLVASIIRVETNFKTSKQSHKGALGLMQIMPNTANWIMDSAQIQKVPLDSVKHEPGTNIELGTWYLHNLSMKFQDNPVAIVAAYNAGPGKVQEWLDKGVWDGKKSPLSKSLLVRHDIMYSGSFITTGNTRKFIMIFKRQVNDMMSLFALK